MGTGMVFEELQVWQLARGMVKRVYGLTAGIKDFGFNDQLQRAAVSVMNNIAEGYESGTSLLLKRYFEIAKGSCGEVRSMMYVGMDTGYITPKDGEEVIGLCRHIAVMIKKFLNNRK